MDLPRVVDVIALAHCPELNLGERHRSLGTLGITEQVIGEPITGVGGSAVRCGIRLESELTARELIAQLVVLVPTQFTAESERMVSFGPTEIIQRLIAAVPVLVWAIRKITE
jgi:hypothetical protein